MCFFSVVCHYSVWLFPFCLCLSLVCLLYTPHLSDLKSHFPLLSNLPFSCDLTFLVVSTYPALLLVLPHVFLPGKCLFQPCKAGSAAFPDSLVPPPVLLIPCPLLPFCSGLGSCANALFSCCLLFLKKSFSLHENNFLKSMQ